VSIKTGRNDYDPLREFSERTRRELADRDGVLYKRDTEPQPHEVAWIREQIRGRRRVLELGCGFGVWSKVAREVSCEYVGVDGVKQRVQHAEELNPDTIFIHGDARHIDVGDMDFDTVLMVTVLQHVSLEDGILLLKTASRHLPKDGVLIMMESCISYVSEAEAERLYEARPDHMIPKPIMSLIDAVPEFAWDFDPSAHDRFRLIKR
jgi:SAM-dependent methyltransferase